MSEFNVEQMMDKLERNKEVDFNEKSEQIIDNFRLKRLQQIIKVYCAIKASPPKEGLIDQLISIADEGNLRREYDTVIQAFNGADRALRNCFDDETLFERLLQTDIALPTPREFEKARQLNYSYLQIQPGWLSSLSMITGTIKAIDSQLGGSLSLEMYESPGDKLQSDQRPRESYAIFLPNRTTAFFEASRVMSGYEEKNIFQWQTEHEQTVLESVSSRAEVYGLTLDEYLFAQALSAEYGMGMLDAVDDVTIRWSILPGNVVINESGTLYGVGAKWEKLEKMLHIVALEEGGDVPVAPWTAISFENFGGSNE